MAWAAVQRQRLCVRGGRRRERAEKYRFATIKTDKDDYPPGQQALISGSGWQPGETVSLLFQEDPAVHPDYLLQVVADQNGDIYWDQWAPDGHDLGVRFYLTAQGSQSRAQMTFTDSRTITSVGGLPVTVASGASIAVTVSVHDNNAGAQPELCVRQVGASTRNAPGTVTCFDNTNHDGSGKLTRKRQYYSSERGSAYNRTSLPFTTRANQPLSSRRYDGRRDQAPTVLVDRRERTLKVQPTRLP